MLVIPRDGNAQLVLQTKPGTGFSCARQLSFDDPGGDRVGV
ncbi:MAG TPA: hypothetical protein VFB65_20300 [Pyrinomonadaceae bacterium]|nr:hypothetical protein [Pyrinomonadaceae bacterium]